MPYGLPEDVRSLDQFPQHITDETIVAWQTMRQGEIDSVLLSKGVAVPVTAPETFVNLLQMAETYGAASMVEASPGAGQNPSDLAAAVEMYAGEYRRILAWLQGLTAVELANLGLVLISPPGGTGGLAYAPGLALVGNQYVSDPPHWSDVYPIRRVP